MGWVQGFPTSEALRRIRPQSKRETAAVRLGLSLLRAPGIRGVSSWWAWRHQSAFLGVVSSESRRAWMLERRRPCSSHQARTGRLWGGSEGERGPASLQKAKCPCPALPAASPQAGWRTTSVRERTGASLEVCTAAGAVGSAGGGRPHSPGRTRCIPGAPAGCAGIAGIPGEGTSSRRPRAFSLSRSPRFSIRFSGPPPPAPPSLSPATSAGASFARSWTSARERGEWFGKIQPSASHGHSWLCAFIFYFIFLRSGDHGL